MTLINELNKYEEDFNLCLIYKKDIRIEELETQLKKKEYILFESNNFGTDIIPSLMCYELIKHKFDFKYIIKLHTKSDKTWFNDLTNFYVTDGMCYDKGDAAYCATVDCIPEDVRQSVDDWTVNDNQLTYIYCKQKQ